MNNPKKKYGQNFLTDKNLLQKIVRDSFLTNKDVVEVGPGMGALTNYIVLEARKVIAYEIDTDLHDCLDSIAKKHQNLKVVYNDFLKVDLNKDKEKYQLDDEVILIGNLPYYITSPIIFKFLETTFLKQAIIMIQKEVADRILAKPKEKAYNALSVIMQYLADVKRLVNVSKKMFAPMPKVDSVVITISKKSNTKNKEEFISFVKAAFNQKRKTLVNNLHDCFHKEKSEIITFLQNNEMNELTRAEEISVEKFIRLSEAWYESM